MLRSMRLCLVLAAVLFSTGAVALKSLTMDPLPRACMRSGTAAVFLFLLLPNARRRPSLRTLLLSCVFALSTSSTVMAVSNAPAATALFLQAISPGLVLIGGALFLKERMQRTDFVSLSLIAAGFTCLMLAPHAASETAPDPARGLAFACVGAVAWACVVLGLRRASSLSTADGDASQQAIAWGNAIACFATLLLAWPLPSVGARDVLVIGYLGVFQIGLAYALLVRGLRSVPAFQASMLLLLEPVLTPVWTFFVHGERPHAWTICGGALALSGSAANAFFASRRSSRAS